MDASHASMHLSPKRRGFPQFPAVVKAVRMGHALLSIFLQIAKGLLFLFKKHNSLHMAQEFLPYRVEFLKILKP